MPTAEIPPDYDISLRNVFKVGGAAFLRAIEVQIDQKIDTDVSKVRKRSVDLLGIYGDDQIVHVEFQRSYGARMPIRMLDYYGSILSVLTFEDPKYLSYRLKQVLVHVANGESEKMWHEVKYENVTFKFPSYNTLGIEAKTLLDDGDIGDAVLSILCKGGSNPSMVHRALTRILEADTRVELQGMYIALSSAIPDGYVNVMNGVPFVGIEIDFGQIEPFQQQLKSRLVAAAIDYFTERADELFPNESMDADILEILLDMPAAAIDSIRRSLVSAPSIREAVLGPESYTP